MPNRELFSPDSPIEFPIRPLSKGMVKDMPSNGLEVGAVLDARNLIVKPDGLYRRPGLAQLVPGTALNDPPIQAIIPYWAPDGTQTTLVADQSNLYTVGPDGYTVIENDDELVPAPWVFSCPDGQYLEWTVLHNGVLFSDGTNPIFFWDPMTEAIRYYLDSPSYIANTICFHGDRIFLGGTIESNTVHRYRIRWTEILDKTQFGLGTGYWLDLPYHPGKLLKLLPLGRLLVAYYEDAIYVGRPTNIRGNQLPFAFEEIPTGGNGLAGQRAVVPFVDGHFFVGRDDIYFLPLNLQLQPIGSRVVSETIHRASRLDVTHAVMDPANNRCLFGFADESSDVITRVWSFCYKTNGWSYDLINAHAIIGSSVNLSLTIDGLAAVIDPDTYDEGLTMFDSIDGIDIGGSDYRVYFSLSDNIYYLSKDNTADVIGSSTVPIPMTLETADYDFNSLDRVKTFLRLSMKFTKTVSVTVPFAVSGSTDRGATWYPLGTLYIAPGHDEGYVNFRITGSMCRFRLQSNATVVPFTVMEIALRVRGRSIEAKLGYAST